MKKASDNYTRGVTWRAVAIGVLLAPINSYWIFLTEIVRYQGHPTTISIFYNVVFNLAVLIVLNSVVRKVAPSKALNQGELITIYVMLNISSALVGHDSIQVLVPGLAHPFYFADDQNQWGSLFNWAYPKWLTVQDYDALRGFYQGQSSIYRFENWSAWLVPVLFWTGFIVVMLFVFLCINVLLRKQWTENEKLTYPLVQLPLDMTAENSALFRNRLFWFGFAAVAVIDIINGLNLLYPSVPAIPIKLGDQGKAFTTRPWINIGWLPVQLYPFGIGLGMLVPTDLSFSCWFFFVFSKAQRVVAATQGWDAIPNFPFAPEQSFGAYMGICAFAIWAARRHIARIARSFVFRNVDPEDAGEAVPYRVATWGVILGASAMFAFSLAAGLSAWLAIPYFVIFFALAITITRLRAELGTPVHDLHQAGPDLTIPTLLGPSRIETRDLAVLTLYFSFNRAYRSHPMPFQLEGLKMAERAKIDYRGLFIAMVIAGGVGTLAAFWSILHTTYKVGATAGMSWHGIVVLFGAEPVNRLEAWVKSPRPPDEYTAWAITTGLCFTLLLNTLRMRLTWFPFHPVGYAISSTWSMHQLWIAMFVSWLMKVLILRYGGLKLYRQALPFFLGVVLGECVVGGLWTIVGILLNIPSYAFWP